MKDIPKIKELFDYLELMATLGDDEVKGLLNVTILARLGDSKKLLKNAYKCVSLKTKK